MVTPRAGRLPLGTPLRGTLVFRLTPARVLTQTLAEGSWSIAVRLIQGFIVEDNLVLSRHVARGEQRGNRQPPNFCLPPQINFT